MRASTCHRALVDQALAGWRGPLATSILRVWSTLLALVGLVALLLSPAVANAQGADPFASWRTAETPHFRVHYRAEERTQAEAVARIAEKVYPRITSSLQWEPRGRTEVVVLAHRVAVVTDREGRFELDVPAGAEVTLHAWHPLLRRREGEARLTIEQAVAGETRTLDIHVSQLRNALRLPENGWRITAIYAHGYRLEPLEVRP